MTAERPSIDAARTAPAVQPAFGGDEPVGTARVRLFAAARAAVGLRAFAAPAGGTIGDLLERLAAASVDPGGTTVVLNRCTFLHNQQATADRARVLAPGDTLDVLPPFAGG